MKTIYKWMLGILILILPVALVSCSDDDSSETTIIPVKPDQNDLKNKIIDKNATAETFALFYNLKYYPQANILFGHYSDNVRGYDGSAEWHSYEPANNGRSDVKDVTGVYPAMTGFDFRFLTDTVTSETPALINLMKNQTVEAYNRGQVITYSWYYKNPVDPEEEDVKSAVAEILPGGRYNDVFNDALQSVADFSNSLTGADGKKIPVIFNPFYSNDADTIWWGRWGCTPDQYIELYRYTVDYMKNHGVHNFIYAYSPNSFKPLEEDSANTRSLTGYPGDGYVDIIGVCNLYESEAPFYAELGRQFRYLVNFAGGHGKIPAVAITGSKNISNSTWFTDILYKALLMEGLGVPNRSLAYVMIWENLKSAYYTPYKGHPAEPDFISFKNKGYALFSDKMPNMYVIQ